MSRGVIVDTQFGLKIRNNKIVHISEIPPEENGDECNCICPKCGDKLTARTLGKKNKPCFAHSNKEQCEGSLETALHLFAKEVLKKHKKVKVPQLQIHYTIGKNYDEIAAGIYDEMYDYSNRKNYEYGNEFEDIETKEMVDFEYEYEDIENEVKITEKEGYKEFDEVVEEVNMVNIKSDIVLYKDNTEILVEIKVTHEVDENKKKKIKEQKKTAIEIDLNIDDIDYYNFDRDKVEDLIVNSARNKEWIYNYEHVKKKQKLISYLLDALKKENIELKKKKKRNELRRKRERAAQEKELTELLQKFNIITDPINENEKRKEWENALENNSMWKEVSSKLEITKENMPKYLNQEIKGDFIFDCNRRLWQSRLFLLYLYKWKLSICFSVKMVVEEITKHYSNLINHEYNNLLIKLKSIHKREKNDNFLEQGNLIKKHKQLGDFDKYCPDLAYVIGNFFKSLVYYGFLDFADETKRAMKYRIVHPYYWWFKRKIKELKKVLDKDLSYYHNYYNSNINKQKGYLYIIVLEYWNTQKVVLSYNGYKRTKNYHLYKKISIESFTQEEKLLNDLNDSTNGGLTIIYVS